MSADTHTLPTTQARQRIHAAAMRLFAEKGVTRVSISELASAAGMARGTIYSHVTDVDTLFEEVAVQLSGEMIVRVVSGFAGVEDPAMRLSIGVRQYIRRAHEEPLWGRFMCRFGLNTALTRALQASEPVGDLESGIASGRYSVGLEQLPAMVGLLAGGTLAAMLPVLEGRSTWRDAGSDAVELLLRALGLEPAEARAIARSELPPLPALAPGL